MRALILCLVLPVVLLHSSLSHAAPIAVRFSEGMARGFLVLSNTKGERIASGDFFQVHRDSDVKTQVLLHFKDGSVHDETVIWTQRRHFVLQSYHLIQKGPSFKQDMDATLERSTGKYTVKVKPRGGEEKVLNGALELPQDVYNGMIPTVVKNLKGKGDTVHMVAFTPAPRVIDLEITPIGEDKVTIGDLKRTLVHYLLKPKLGLLLKIGAAMTGKTPPDDHLWILASDVPAFIRFDGPLAPDNPIWSIELTSPVWPKR